MDVSDGDPVGPSCEEVLSSELLTLCPEAARFGYAEMSLSFAGEDEMRSLNREYRGIDEPTDVLSFPMCEEDGKFVPPPASAVLPLGDVVICPAMFDGTRDALCLLLAHGFLHLLAWDHDTPEREAAMFERQDAIAVKLAAAMGDAA
jgi:probable rRNA maturation factor